MVVDLVRAWHDVSMTPGKRIAARVAPGTASGSSCDTPPWRRVSGAEARGSRTRCVSRSQTQAYTIAGDQPQDYAGAFSDPGRQHQTRTAAASGKARVHRPRAK